MNRISTRIGLYLLGSLLGCASAEAAPGAVSGEEETVDPQGLQGMKAPPGTFLGGQPTPCPDTYHVVEHWPGEYPSPVVHVLKTAEVEARFGPCGTTGEVMATLKPGLYHPWSRSKDITKVAFFSIAQILHYELLQEVTFGEGRGPDSGTLVVAKGSVIETLAYLSEGVCLLRIDGKLIDEHCPGNGGQEARFRQIDPATGEGSVATGTWDNLLRVSTPGKSDAWVVVTESYPFIHPDIVQGTVFGWQEVGPSTASQ